MMDKDLLYLNNYNKKSFQWELWTYCNNNCKFCYLGGENKKYSKERHLKSLLDLSTAIDNLDFDVYNNIGLMGGEFFQGQLNDIDVYNEFFKIIRKIFSLYINHKIGSIWISCTLTIGDQKHLYEVLDLANEMKVFPDADYASSGLWLCTSWDAEGRFHNDDMKSNWEYHMKKIKEKYPWIKFNTTIILMQKFIDLYLENKFKPKEFMENYNTTLFYKQPGIFSEYYRMLNYNASLDLFKKNYIQIKQQMNKDLGFDLFPTRISFLKFLHKYYINDYDTFDKLFNINYRSDELHRNSVDIASDTLYIRNKQCKVEETKEYIKEINCGHNHTYMPYIDSAKCCLCDKNEIIE